MKNFLSLFCVFFLASSVSAQQRPDMVVFLSDDHTCRDSAVYGSTEILTPNMVRIADAGMTFDRAYVASPSCAPSRAALLTGFYPANNGAEPNHARPNSEIRKLPDYLQKLGYEVVSFGKVGHYGQTPEYGFDVARHYKYHEDIAVDEAIKWLRARQSDKPLCLFVGTNWPHVPWPKDTSGIDPKSVSIPPNHVDNEVTREWRSRYLAAVHTMDKELGEVYDAAREVLGEDVFFLHTSDHGAQWPFAKWNLYEDGIRTPLIVSWPGKIAAGERTSAMVSWIDILPTLVDVAGEEVTEKIDGRSFLSVLRSETDAHRESIFAAHSGDGNHNVFPIRAVVRADGWKFVQNLHPEFRFESHTTEQRDDSGYWASWLTTARTDESARDKVRRYLYRPAEELYRPETDPFEQDNLIEDPAAAGKLAELRQELDGWMTATADTKTVYGRPKFIPRPGSPNIVLVFIDDMGWGDFSCFGNEDANTPHIDQLAKEGVRFEQFYVNSPICSPSRTAISTGQYPQRWRITSFLNHRQANKRRGMAQWLDPAAPTLARILQHAGYATGHFGKWHMGGQRDVTNAPPITAYGFDSSLTNFEGMGPKLLPLTLKPGQTEPGKIWQDAENLGDGYRWMLRSEITTGFVDAALPFIDNAVSAGKPFYINLWPDDVHSPFWPPLEEWGDGSKRSLYLSVLESMDQQFGKLFDRIRNDECLRNNTLVLICSDNGPEPDAGQAGPFRGFKAQLYEGGIRSPLIVWGPGIVEKTNHVDTESVFAAIDIPPSLLALVETTAPAGVHFDGEPLKGTLLGKGGSRQAPIFFRRPPDRNSFYGDENLPDLAVRSGKWKLLCEYDGSDVELYDLSVDLSESDNVAADHPAISKALTESLLEWHQSMPPDNGPNM